MEALDPLECAGRNMGVATDDRPSPERQAYAAELRGVLERAVLALPEGYRLVFMLRDIEGMDTVETAESLEISEKAVKTRLHRARTLLRKELYSQMAETTDTLFQFAGARCDRVTSGVLTRISHNFSVDNSRHSVRPADCSANFISNVR